MYQVIEVIKPSGKNYNDLLMEAIADGHYKIVFESEDAEEATKQMLKKQIENTKKQRGRHYELIQDNDPTPIFVENFEFYKNIK